MPPITPVLSICVPSRNRQIYFQKTIKALVSSLRTDIEFVFCDNSDDPSVMNEFIKPYLADPRVTYIATGDKVRPMVDNWEVALEATSGRWISVIGDDDYIDPELAGLIPRIEHELPDVEAIDWSKFFFTWPYDNKPPLSNPIPLLAELHEVPRHLLMERAFRWEHAREVLGCGFGIYHGSVSRTLMERIRAIGKGRYFEHPIVDYDSIFKVIMHGKRFVHCRRPLSVMGACPLSNTAALGNLVDSDKKQATFHKEHQHPMEEMDCYKDYPFRTWLGVTACIAMTHHWFTTEYKCDFPGFEKNFVKSCQLQCEGYFNKAEFDKIVDGYRKAFSIWKGGRFARHFKPEFQEKRPATLFSGLSKDNLFMSDAHEFAADPKQYYDLVSAIIAPIDELKIDFRNIRVREADRAA